MESKSFIFTKDPGNKKRLMIPQEISNKLRSMDDFRSYFETCLQLYVPPNCMFNKDFLKSLIDDQKLMLEMKDIRPINVPKVSTFSLLT